MLPLEKAGFGGECTKVVRRFLYDEKHLHCEYIYVFRGIS